MSFASQLEDRFLSTLSIGRRIHDINLPSPEREYRFHPTRKWRFDFAWPDLRVAVEIEGGIWTGGRHSTALGMAADCEKYNEATAMGWKVLRFTEKQLRDPRAVFETLLATMGFFDGDNHD